jgi:hypothetical protein
VALDQLSLGVAGVVQLHAPNSNASGAPRGTLELTITYEPPSDDENEADNEEAQEATTTTAAAATTKRTASRVGSGKGGATISSGDVTAVDTYESAIDPTSGRK